jgi:hypothetical protein
MIEKTFLIDSKMGAKTKGEIFSLLTYFNVLFLNQF